VERLVYDCNDIQQLLGISKSSVYTFLDQVYKIQEPFRVLKIGKLYRVPKDSFDSWINKSNS
jgi:predicted DNA-binding transcriptional regulator AlpA